jgi:hypothetical protein
MLASEYNCMNVVECLINASPELNKQDEVRYATVIVCTLSPI